MGAPFYVAGHAGNACIGALSVTASSEDALFPAANLQNGYPWKPFRWGSLDTDPTIDFDINMVRDWNFETDANGTTPPSLWSVLTGGGSPTITTAQKVSGTRSCVLDAANEGIYQDFDVSPGGTYRVQAQLRGDGTDPINAYVINLNDGSYSSAGGWFTTKTAWATRTTASFANSAQTFTLLGPYFGEQAPVRMRILFERPSSITGAAYVDDVQLWPQIGVAASMYDLTYHGLTVSVQSDDNSSFSSPTSRGNLSVVASSYARFRRYVQFTPVATERYWRFKLTGTLFEGYIPYIGQTLLGDPVAITQPLKGQTTIAEMPMSGSPDEPLALADAPRYRIDTSWLALNSEYTEAMTRMVGASRHGQEPVFFVPDDDRPEFVYGRGGGLSSFESTRLDGGNFHRYSLSFTDDRYPLRTR